MRLIVELFFEAVGALSVGYTVEVCRVVAVVEAR